MQLIEDLYSYPREDGQLVFSLGYPCDLEEMLIGFHKNELANKYCKEFLLSEIDNAYFVTTKVRFRQNEFKTYMYNDAENSIDINTYDKDVAEELNFVMLTDSHGNNYYAGTVKLSEVDEIWEARTKSEYGPPMPEDLEQKKIIR